MFSSCAPKRCPKRYCFTGDQMVPQGRFFLMDSQNSRKYICVSFWNGLLAFLSPWSYINMLRCFREEGHYLAGITEGLHGLAFYGCSCPLVTQVKCNLLHPPASLLSTPAGTYIWLHSFYTSLKFSVIKGQGKFP